MILLVRLRPPPFGPSYGGNMKMLLLSLSHCNSRQPLAGSIPVALEGKFITSHHITSTSFIASLKTAGEDRQNQLSCMFLENMMYFPQHAYFGVFFMLFILTYCSYQFKNLKNQKKSLGILPYWFIVHDAPLIFAGLTGAK